MIKRSFLWCCFVVLVCGCPSGSGPKDKEDATTRSTGQRNRTDTERPWFKPWAKPLPAGLSYEQGNEGGYLSILESLGGGVAIVDFDRDGHPDLCFPGGGQLRDDQTVPQPTHLLRQHASHEFQPVAVPAGVVHARHYTHGCSATDYNNDGFPDLLLTGYGGLQLLLNNGDGTFEDVTQQVGLDDSLWSSSAGWGDVNGDGHPDLYVAHYVNWSFENNPPCGTESAPDICPPRAFDGLTDVLYLADGEGRFVRANEVGLVEGGKGLAVILADLDDDDDLDIYVANDTTENFLYANRGDGTFEERGVISGVAVDDLANANGSMGIVLTDFNNDQRPDMWVTNYEDEMFGLYRNEGDLNFLHSSAKAGLRSIGMVFVAFGCTGGDYDHDAREEVAVTNGHVILRPRNSTVRQKPLLLRLDSKANYGNLGEAAGEYFGEPHAGRGLAQGDLDNDGDLDLVFANVGEEPSVQENVTGSAASSSLMLHLIGTRSPRSAIGTRVTLMTAKGLQIRQVTGGGSYLSTSDPRVHFGLNGQSPQRLQIRWPSGGRTDLDATEIEKLPRSAYGVLILVEPMPS